MYDKLPIYVSHKEVYAAKIAEIHKHESYVQLIFEPAELGQAVINHTELLHKPDPKVGMYFIQYADGYISFSPAKQCEEGYTVKA